MDSKLFIPGAKVQLCARNSEYSKHVVIDWPELFWKERVYEAGKHGNTNRGPHFVMKTRLV
jgi:hypothetical protein